MATVTYIRESKQLISAMKEVINYWCQDKKVYDRRYFINRGYYL